MRSTLRAAVGCAVLLTAGLALSGCTGDDEAAAPATPPTASASASGSVYLGVDPEEAPKWCAAYGQITSNIAGLGQTPEDAATGVELLAMFDRLWINAGLLEIVTKDEVAANRATVKGYSKVMQMVADGATEDELREAEAVFTAGTEEVRGPLTSSAAKITAICNLGSASPSPSAAQ